MSRTEHLISERERMQRLLRAGVTGVLDLCERHSIPRTVVDKYYRVDRRRLIEEQKVTREIVSDVGYPPQMDSRITR